MSWKTPLVVGLALVGAGLWLHQNPTEEKAVLAFGGEVWQALAHNAQRETVTKPQKTIIIPSTENKQTPAKPARHNTVTSKGTTAKSGSSNTSAPGRSSNGLIITFLPPRTAPAGAPCIIVDASNHMQHVTAAEWNSFVRAHQANYTTGIMQENGKTTFIAEALSLVEPKTPVYYICRAGQTVFSPVSAAEYQAERPKLLAQGYKEYRDGMFYDLIAPHTEVQEPLLDKVITNP